MMPMKWQMKFITYEYDGEGNLTRVLYYNDADKVVDETYTLKYDAEGNLIRGEWDDNADADGKADWIDLYDAEGNLIRGEWDDNADGKADYIHTYGYIEEVITIRYVDSGADGSVDVIYTYTTLQQFPFTWPHNEVDPGYDFTIVRQVMEYDNDVDGEVDSIWNYEYGAWGNITLEEHDNDVDGEIDQTITHEYDADGIYTYAYNEEGTLIREEHDYDGDGEIDQTITHEYDADEINTNEEVTIQNSLPVVSNVSLSPDHVKTNDLITATVESHDADGDRLTFSYDWFVNGKVMEDETGATLDGSHFTRGDRVTVWVTPHDDEDDGEVIDSNTVTIQNSLPVVTNVSLSSDQVKTDDSITASVDVTDDDAGDPESLSYAWHVDGAVVVETGATLDVSHFSRGDRVTVWVTPHDDEDDGIAVASNTVTIQNSLPVVSNVSLGSGRFYTDGTIRVTYDYLDADGDPESLSYAWHVNGVVVGATGPVLGPSYFNKGDTVWVEVYFPATVEAAGIAVASHTVTIQNSLPVVSNVILSPDPDKTNDTITATVESYYDADGDTLTFSYDWFVNGMGFLVEDGTTLGSGNFGEGDSVCVGVTPNDGTGFGKEKFQCVDIEDRPAASCPFSDFNLISFYTMDYDVFLNDIDWMKDGGICESGWGGWWEDGVVCAEYEGGVVALRHHNSDGGELIESLASNEDKWLACEAIFAVPSILDLTAVSDSGTLNDDNITSNTTPTFTGGATVGATVELFANGVSVGSTTVDSSGIYIISSSVLADGTYDITATATVADGYTSAASAALTINLDNTPPRVPTVDSVSFDDANAPTITGTFDETDYVSFTVEIDESVYVLSDKMHLDQAEGTWALALGSPLEAGRYDVIATATDAAGNESGEGMGELTISITEQAGYTWNAAGIVSMDEAASLVLGTLVLDFEPSQDVTFKISTSDLTEIGSISNIVFTPTNWNQVQDVEVDSLSDDIFGDDRVVTIEVGYEITGSAVWEELNSVASIDVTVEDVNVYVGSGLDVQFINAAINNAADETLFYDSWKAVHELEAISQNNFFMSYHSTIDESWIEADDVNNLQGVRDIVEAWNKVHGLQSYSGGCRRVVNGG